MFSQAYWHHAVRSIKAMLTRAVVRLLVIGDEKGERWRNEFRSGFEDFVLALPTVLYRGQPVQPALFPPVEGDSATSDVRPTDIDLRDARGTIAPTDAAVIAFLRSWLVRAGAKEAELLDDVMARRLYKRLFIFSYERSPKEWKSLVDQWDRLSSGNKVRVYEQIEKVVVSEVDKRAQEGPYTETLNETEVDRLRLSVAALRPLVLIDVPGPRPGSDIPLYYVIEAQRRALRRDERAVGDAQASGVWQQFGAELRERAGKVRIFCHPSFIDLVESAIMRDDFVSMFQQAVASVK
jgi:hypothetical protein